MLDSGARSVYARVHLDARGANAHLFVSATSLQVSSGIETYVSAGSRIKKEELEFAVVDSGTKTSPGRRYRRSRSQVLDSKCSRTIAWRRGWSYRSRYWNRFGKS